MDNGKWVDYLPRYHVTDLVSQQVWDFLFGHQKCPFLGGVQATFTAFPHFRKGISGAWNENLRPVLKSGLWRGSHLPQRDASQLPGSTSAVDKRVLWNCLQMALFCCQAEASTSPNQCLLEKPWHFCWYLRRFLLKMHKNWNKISGKKYWYRLLFDI